MMKFNQIKEALIKNWKTTAIGVIILIAAILWVAGVIDTDDFLKVAAFASAFGFFGSKDSNK